MRLGLRCVCVLMMLVMLPKYAAVAADLKLRALGAKGDGHTDDRAAIEKVLSESKGAVVDGEGAVYAVHGNIEINSDVHLRNATLIQAMTPVDIAKFIPSAQGKGKISVQPAEALKATVKSLPLMQADGVASYSDDVQLSAEQLKAVLPSIALNTL